MLPSLHVNESLHHQRRPQRRAAPATVASPSRRPRPQRKNTPANKSPTWTDALHRSVDEEADDELRAAIRSSSEEFILRRRSSSNEDSQKKKVQEKPRPKSKDKGSETGRETLALAPLLDIPNNGAKVSNSLRSLDSATSEGLRSRGIGKQQTEKQKKAPKKKRKSQMETGDDDEDLASSKKKSDKHSSSNSSLQGSLRNTTAGLTRSLSSSNLRRSSLPDLKSVFQKIKIPAAAAAAVSSTPSAKSPMRKSLLSSTTTTTTASNLSYFNMINNAVSVMADLPDRNNQQDNKDTEENEALQAMLRYGHASTNSFMAASSDARSTATSTTSQMTPSRRRQQHVMRRRKSDEMDPSDTRPRRNRASTRNNNSTIDEQLRKLTKAAGGSSTPTWDNMNESRKSERSRDHAARKSEKGRNSGGMDASRKGERTSRTNADRSMDASRKSERTRASADRSMDASRKSRASKSERTRTSGDHSSMDASKKSVGTRASADQSMDASRKSVGSRASTGSTSLRLRRRRSMNSTTTNKKKTSSDRLHHSFPSSMDFIGKEETQSRSRRSRSGSKSRSRRHNKSMSSSSLSLSNLDLDKLEADVKDSPSSKGRRKEKLKKAHSGTSLDQPSSLWSAENCPTQSSELESQAVLPSDAFSDGNCGAVHGGSLKRPSSGYRRSFTFALGKIMGKRADMIQLVEEEELLLQKGTIKDHETSLNPEKNDGMMPANRDQPKSHRHHQATEFSTEEETSLNNVCVRSFPNLNYHHEDFETEIAPRRSSLGGDEKKQPHWMSPFEDNFIVAVKGTARIKTVDNVQNSSIEQTLKRSQVKRTVTGSTCDSSATNSDSPSDSPSLNSPMKSTLPDSPRLSFRTCADYHKLSSADNSLEYYSGDGTRSDDLSNIEDAGTDGLENDWSTPSPFAIAAKSGEVPFEVEESYDELHADTTEEGGHDDFEVDMPSLDDIKSCDISVDCSKSDRTCSSGEDDTEDEDDSLWEVSSSIMGKPARDASTSLAENMPRERINCSGGAVVRPRTVSESELSKKRPQKRREPAKTRSDGSYHSSITADSLLQQESGESGLKTPRPSSGPRLSPPLSAKTCSKQDQTPDVNDVVNHDACSSLKSDVTSIEKLASDANNHRSMFFTRNGRSSWSQLPTTCEMRNPGPPVPPRSDNWQLRRVLSAGAAEARSSANSSTETSLEELMLQGPSSTAFERWKDTGSLGGDVPTRLPRRHSGDASSPTKVSKTAQGLMEWSESNLRPDSYNPTYLPVSLRSAVKLTSTTALEPSIVTKKAPPPTPKGNAKEDGDLKPKSRAIGYANKWASLKEAGKSQPKHSSLSQDEGSFSDLSAIFHAIDDLENDIVRFESNIEELQATNTYMSN